MSPALFILGIYWRIFMSIQDIAELARSEIRKALSSHFLDYVYEDGRTAEEHLDEATKAVLDGITRLLKQTPGARNKLGATFMTESASMRSGKDGLPGIPPRNV